MFRAPREADVAGFAGRGLDDAVGSGYAHVLSGEVSDDPIAGVLVQRALFVRAVDRANDAHLIIFEFDFVVTRIDLYRIEHGRGGRAWLAFQLDLDDPVRAAAG